ncbi:glycosyltransferase [Flavobacterium sp. 17A]|uniref:Glycosyltransferase n=1 Tax=Flavobacterium potami TaxID=2872310 RepID=A0A9X1HD84_9FLAO|nr:glycosyltransferase [Flavobacterium potami]MBZ4036585.1 glycosyltransferase [Flavobacterium potami]
MKFSLIICTYMRPDALLKLLISVQDQILYPNEILIIDGSLDERTKKVLKENNFENLKYFMVSEQDRGLTKQRNVGISKVNPTNDFVCFLDDDIVLEPSYFENLLHTYHLFPEALGVGGYIDNEIKWEKTSENYTPKINEFYFDGWKRKDGSRFVLRKKLNLDSDCAPAFSPLFSHARSAAFLPPSNKIYEVELLMGGVSSFRKSVFNDFTFSDYFEGYGLYEDADFSLRLAKKGPLYINTSARLNHFHVASGRPNLYKYGKMVVVNGWYVWRVKNPKPIIKDSLKWHCITLLLIILRFSNIFTTRKRKEAFSESVGRIIGWLQVLIRK